MVKRKPGRPTKEERIVIEQDLLPYFNMDLNPEKAHLQTGYDYKTCTSYWKIFKGRHLKARYEEIGLRQRHAVSQFELAYDNIIFNLNAQLNEIIGLKHEHKATYKKEVEELKAQGTEEIPSYTPDWKLEDKFTELNKELSIAIDKKTAVITSPFIDEDTEAATLHRIEQKMKEDKENQK